MWFWVGDPQKGDFMSEIDYFDVFASMIDAICSDLSRRGTYDLLTTAVSIAIYSGKPDGSRYCVSSLSEHLNVPRPTLIRAINRMCKAGRITSEMQGKRRVYSHTFDPRDDERSSGMIKAAEVAFHEARAKLDQTQRSLNKTRSSTRSKSSRQP